jgi:hypothetical protein
VAATGGHWSRYMFRIVCGCNWWTLVTRYMLRIVCGCNWWTLVTRYMFRGSVFLFITIITALMTWSTYISALLEGFAIL